MYSLEKIRELNKIKIFTAKDGEAVHPLFTAYTSQGYNWNLEIETSDLLSTVNRLVKNPLVASLGSEAFGVQMAFDFERKMVMNGVKPLALNLKCFLVVEESYEKDIAQPLQRLINYVLPSRGVALVEKASAWTLGKQEGATTKFGDTIWGTLNRVIDALKDYTGEIYSLNIPAQVRTHDEETSLCLSYGTTTLDGIMIKGISISAPTITSITPDGRPAFDYVEVSLQIETLRGATTSLVDFTKKPLL